MIRLFGTTDTDFSTNGDIVLQPKRAVIVKKDNGSFYLDIDVDISYINDFTQNRIIVANTPQGNQAFRIGNVKKGKSKLTAKCNHVFYDTQNYLIEDSYVYSKNCNDALDHLNSATSDTSPYTTISDITTINSYRCVRTSLFDALKVVVARWGGHIVRDNYNIEVRNTIGADNGVVVRYAKNLREITCEENWNDVITKILPTGTDGIMLNSLDNTQSPYIVSDIQYSIPYTKTIDFTQDINSDDFEDEDGNIDEEAYKQALIDDLRKQATDYLNENKVPKVLYTLNANLEKITDVGDIIEVIDERLNINILTNLIGYEYDCILEKYKQLEFGNFEPQLSDLVSSITANTTDAIKENNNAIKITLNDELNEAKQNILGMLGNSYVIYDGDKILVVDSLPKETATNVIMINSGGIAFSQTGINGTFNSAWLIDGTMDMQNINVINLTADMVKGGTLKLGSNLNQNGIIELYNETNNLIGLMNKDGLKIFGNDGSYVVMNDTEGFAGYDANNTKIFWVDFDELHIKKAVIEDEITLSSKLRFIPITITNNGSVVNDGIGLVAVGGE